MSFFVILPGLDTRKSVLKLETLRCDIEKAKFTDEQDNSVSVTLSAEISDTHAGDCTQAVKIADQHLYHAKENGRNRTEFEGSI